MSDAILKLIASGVGRFGPKRVLSKATKRTLRRVYLRASHDATLMASAVLGRLAFSYSRFRRAAGVNCITALEQSAFFFAVNKHEVTLLLLDKAAPDVDEFCGADAEVAIGALQTRKNLERRALTILDRRTNVPTDAVFDASLFRQGVERYPFAAKVWLSSFQRRVPIKASKGYALLKRLGTDLELLEFRAAAYRAAELGPTEPFNAVDAPLRTRPEPKRRSVLFLENCYYNFYYLAQALRKRGWDAVSLTTVAPNAPDNRLFHGSDIRIYDADPVKHQEQLARFMAGAADRFGIVHTYGLGVLSGIPTNRDVNSEFDRIPWDILSLKRQGVLIGYSHSGCLDAVSQTVFRAWSPTMCANCVWSDKPDVCSDSRNLNWGRKLIEVVDLFCIETDPGIDLKDNPRVFKGPLTFAMDPEVWKPNLNIPHHLRRHRSAEEVVIYHAVGNYFLRTRGQKNVKGTGAVFSAVEQLQSEGLPVRLDFVHDVPSIDNRFIQSQADIIVDQLHYGRYGALAREGMMLGKPVVGRINRLDGDGVDATQCIMESPIVNADEASITDVLRELVCDPSRRATIGRNSREHALYWWSADRLAGRFEQVYDHIRAHGRPPLDTQVP